jgi:hypothetical protein
MLRPILAVLVAMTAATASAELELSLTVEGSPEEIMQVLELLRGAGLGGAAPAGEDALRLEVFSSTGEATAATPPPPPVAALNEPAVSPSTTPPGAPVLLTVTVADPEHQVDTIAAWLRDTSVTLDLHDNGQDGDALAGDGIWSATLLVPQATPVGSYTVTFSAYNAKGDPILVPVEGAEPAPLTGNAGLTIGG